MKCITTGNIIAIGVILIVVLGGALAYSFSQGESQPAQGISAAPTLEPPTVEVGNIVITPPDSLADVANEIAAQYPALADMLNNPELASAYKDFYVTYQNFGQEAALEMARQRGILNENNDVVMILILDTTEDTANLITALENEGVIVEANYQDRVNIVIPQALILQQLEAEEPELIIERISGLEHVIGLRLPEKLLLERANVAVGQGVAVTLANAWHSQGITGQGVKVGVLDLGFAGYERLLGSELPNAVTVQTFGNPARMTTEVHGTACAEIVHEMAPDAEIVLAYFDGTEAALGLAVEWLLSQDVDIVSNSTSISGLTPMDGTGFAAELVNRVHDAGVLWVSAAGNRADEHYRGVFNDSNSDTLHEYAPDMAGLPFTIKANTRTHLILTWNDWGTVNQDYDLILYDKNGTLLAKAEDYQSGQPGQRPMELISYQFPKTDTYLLSIQNRNGQARGDATFDLFVYNGQLPPEFRVGEGSLGTPSDARGSFTIGAVHWSNDVLEPYSSQGPTNDGRVKPDLVAPSAVANSSYAPSIFDGTSAATPHVSGAAALILQTFPNFTPDDVSDYMQNRAVKLGNMDFSNQFGAGRLNLGDAP